MAISIRPITRPLPLAEYDEGLEIRFDEGPPRAVYVWVNPPRAVLDERDQLVNRSLAAYRLLEDLNQAKTKAKKRAKGEQEKVNALASELAAVGSALAEWYARLWSQNPDAGTHWTADELRALASSETDPELYSWLTRRSMRMLKEHREQARKN